MRFAFSKLRRKHLPNLLLVRSQPLEATKIFGILNRLVGARRPQSGYADTPARRDETEEPATGDRGAFLAGMFARLMLCRS